MNHTNRYLTGDSWQEVYEVSRSLRALAHELRTPVVAVAPLSHVIEHRQQRALQRSGIPGRLLQADTEHILFLHRNQPSPVESTSSHLTIATLLVTKQRNGLVIELDISIHTEHSV